MIDKVLDRLLRLGDTLSDRSAGLVNRQRNTGQLADHVGRVISASVETTAIDRNPMLELIFRRVGNVGR